MNDFAMYQEFIGVVWNVKPVIPETIFNTFWLKKANAVIKQILPNLCRLSVIALVCYVSSLSRVNKISKNENLFHPLYYYYDEVLVSYYMH